MLKITAIGNLTNAAKTYGTSVEDDIRTGKGHLCAMHLKETVPGVFREVPFGTGHVDFPKGIETAWQCGVRRFVEGARPVGDEVEAEALPAQRRHAHPVRSGQRGHGAALLLAHAEALAAARNQRGVEAGNDQVHGGASFFAGLARCDILYHETAHLGGSKQ